MKKITLVNPSFGFNTGCIPLGLASISAYLKKYGEDIQVTLLDSNCQDIYKEFNPDTDVVAITAVTQDIKNAIGFAEYVKLHRKGTPVILGGVHISTYEILPEIFDAGVMGEGEETVLEIMSLNNITPSTLADVRGVCYNIDGKTHITKPRLLIEPLDKIPLPDYSILNMEYYLLPRKTIPYYTGKTLSMMSSRGCPFKCLSGESLIDTTNGVCKIKDLVGKTPKVLTRDLKTGEPVYAQATIVAKTGINEKMLRITFTGGSYIDCTPDHKFITFKNGNQFIKIREYEIEAQNLTAGNSVRAIHKESNGTGGYVDIVWGRRKRVKQHKLIMESMLERKMVKIESVHHIDHNVKNNVESNLKLTTTRDHIPVFHPEISERMITNNPTKDYPREYFSELGKKQKGVVRTSESRINYRLSKLGDKNPNYKHGQYVGKKSRIEEIPLEINHVVETVEILPGVEDAYCMEVPGYNWFYANDVLVHNCVFCSTQVHWKKFRGFSAARVIEEIEALLEYGAEIILIYDDLFIADKKRFAEIHRLVVEKGIDKKAKFMCLVRSDMLDDKMMTMLKEMNVVVTGIGMESGCPHILDYLKKRTTTIETNRKAIELSNSYNIPTLGSFMIGNPGETEEELLQTLAFIRSYRYSPYLSPLSYISTAFPGTEFWKYAKAKGIDVEDFDNITMDIPSDINELAYAPLLTDIPVARFFEIAQMFKKEQRYGTMKRYIFQPANFLDYIKAYGIGMYIEKNPFTGIIEVSKIFYNYFKYKKIADMRFIPVTIPSYNCILDDSARAHYQPVVDQMFKYAPRMMRRKIPRANVQQAFIFNAVHTLAKMYKDPRILCIGSYEDTAVASLKAIGYAVDEIDPAINYDLHTFFNLPETGKYDIIFSTSVIEHVEDDGLFVEEATDLLKPGGVFLLTCDFNNHYRTGDSLPISDVRFYTMADMNRLFERTRGCYFADAPKWTAKPDFVFERCLYSFATMTLVKEYP